MKKTLSFILAVVLMMLCFFQIKTGVNAESEQWDVINTRGVTGDDIVAQAQKYIGAGYSNASYKTRTGFTTPQKFDCSGFVYRVCRDVGLASSHENSNMGVYDNDGKLLEGSNEAGYYITAHTGRQRNYGDKLTSAVNNYLANGDYSGFKPGDLLFFDYKSNGTGGTDHVGIYTSNGKIINATSSKGIVETSLSQTGWPDGKLGNSLFDAVRLVESCRHSNRNSCGKCTNCGNIDLSKHALSAYNNVGKCPTCSHDFDYDANKSTSAAGVYKVTVSGGINLYTKPYSAAPTTGTKIAKGAEITVEHSVKNHYGNTWYCFTYGGQKVYTSADNVAYVSTATLPQSITCTLTDPTEGQKIVKGSHPVQGTVTSKNYPLQEVKAYLDGSCIATVTLGSAYSLDIRSSDINTNLTFGKLSYGNHTLVIKARDTKHSDLVTVMTRNFVITDSSGNTGSSTSCSCSTSYAGYYLCTTTGTNLYIRSGHGSSYSTLGNVTKGAVAYIDKASGTGSGDWGHVTFNGVSGYCSMQYMKKLNTYTVSYNANGGSGAPSSQTKIQDVALTLSSSKPTRSGYTFLGWATSSSATSAKYSAGGSYTSNAGVTLYAVWKSNACTHSYSSTATKAATCSTAGTRTYTCTKCGNSYTESIAATGNHVYGSWSTTKAATCTATGTQQRKCNTCTKTESKTLSATGHNYRRLISIATCSEPEVTTYTCTNCGNSYKEQTGTQTAPHKWDSGVVTTSPTCAREGVKIYTCTVCKQTKTETNPKLQTHAYTEWYLTSDTAHKRECDICGEIQLGAHEFYDKWMVNEKGHSKLCKICNGNRNYSHTPGPAATETEPQVCTTCDYVIKPALGHTHQWDNEFSYDFDTHWHACEGCSEKQNVEQHTYQNTCDDTCEICGGSRPVIHLPSQGWESDKDNHWYICFCGEINQFGAHMWEDGTCTVCGTKQTSNSEQPDRNDQAGEIEQPGKDEQPKKDRKPSFIERVIDCFVNWFEQMKDPEVIRDLIDAAKQQKMKREILADVQEGLLPDGEYRMMFYEDKIHIIDGVEYAYVDILEYVELEDSYVRSLKVGDVIDLTKYGLVKLEVINTEISHEDTIYNVDVHGDHLVRAENGKWRIHWCFLDILKYVKEHSAIEIAPNLQIVDEAYKLIDENGDLADYFTQYGKYTDGELEIRAYVEDGKVVKAYYSCDYRLPALEEIVEPEPRKLTGVWWYAVGGSAPSGFPDQFKLNDGGVGSVDSGRIEEWWTENSEYGEILYMRPAGLGSRLLSYRFWFDGNTLLLQDSLDGEPIRYFLKG